MPQRRLTILLVLALAVCVAPASFGQAAIYGFTFWRMKPLPDAISSDVRTAPLGHFLFTQEFASDDIATISSPAENVTGDHINFAAGAQFLAIDGADSPTYCDPATHGNWWTGPARTCFLDRDNDGVFDRVYRGRALQNDSFVPTLIFTAGDVHLPYAKGTPGSQRLLSAGIVVTRSILGAYRLQFAITGKSTPIILMFGGGDTREDIHGAQNAALINVPFRAQDLPVTLHVMGAEIRVEAIDNDAVTYTVHSTFDPNTPVDIAYSWDLPRSD
jgi:hypothetical protein